MNSLKASSSRSWEGHTALTELSVRLGSTSLGADRIARAQGRDRIRERISQVKADQKARGRFLGGKRPFGYRLCDDGELVPHEAEQEAIREMVALKAEGRSLRAIAAAVQAGKSHQGVADVLRALQAA